MPDFPADKPPDYRAPDDAKGMDAIGGTDPFIMMADGKGWLYAPAGLLDGPLPTHYEPSSRRSTNPLYPEIWRNPAALSWNRPDNPEAQTGDPRYPLVATTFRLTEHHTAGAMSRNLPWLAELQPEMFAEIDPILAADRGIEDGGWMVIETERAEIEARARVTERMRPLKIDGKRLHQVGAAVALGLRGRAPGDAANDLGVLSGDPNVSIQEDKAFTCNVRAGRRTRETTAKLAGVRADSHAGPRHRRPVRGPRQRMTEIAIQRDGAQRMGFFTDTTVCIGCKACEVACKQWNDLPSDGGTFRKGGSYDSTGQLSGNTWRHVRFVELADAGGGVPEDEIPDLVALAAEKAATASVDVAAAIAAFDNWVFMSDVCKHCTNAGCLDACPTGALIRTEFETVVLQPDVCNGCGYCVPAVPVRRRRPRRPTTAAPASAPSATTGSRTAWSPRARRRARPTRSSSAPTTSSWRSPSAGSPTLHARGVEGAYLYGAADAPEEQLAGGLGAFFLLTEPPERYGLPANAESPIQENVVPATLAAVGAGLLAAAGVAAAFLWEKAAMSEFSPPSAPPPRPTFGEKSGEKVELHIGQWKDGRWSYLFGDDTAYKPRAARRRGDRRAARDARTGELPTIVQGPIINAPVWTWEVPLYFWFGGIAAGSSFVALACDLAGDEDSAAMARKVALAALRPLAAAADHGPRAARALLQHAAHLQAALADVDGRVGADRVRQPRPRRRSAPTCSAAGARRRAWAAPTRSSAATSAPTPACCSPPPPSRCGPARGCSSARSSSARRRRRARPPPARARRRPACPSVTRRGARSATSRRARWPPSWRCPSSTSAGSDRSPPALEEGRPGKLFKRREVVVRAGLALRFARKPLGPSVHHLASALYLAAGLLFRYAWVGAGRESASDDRVVAQMARDKEPGS